MKTRYSLHKIYQRDNCPFCEEEYSRFKFGDISVAEKFGKELFNGFIHEYGDLVLSQLEIVLFPSPYYAIPTASNFLCRYFKEMLNQFLFENNRKACIEGKIHRNQTYIQDYGNMDFKQRLSLISNDTYYIDKNFIQDKFCLFLDDIKITGSHERTVDKILAQFNVAGTFVFIYYAELMNDRMHPNIENHYNYFAVKTIQDIIKLLNNKSFQFNTRVVKYILLLDEVGFNYIMQHISSTQQGRLLNLAISNNYHQIKEYQSNIKNLKNKIWLSTYKKGKERASVLQSLPLD